MWPPAPLRGLERERPNPTPLRPYRSDYSQQAALISGEVQSLKSGDCGSGRGNQSWVFFQRYSSVGPLCNPGNPGNGLNRATRPSEPICQRELDMRLAVILLIAMMSITAHADDGENFHAEVRNGKVAIDHIATIGSYQYELYVDRSKTPPLAVAVITRESMRRLLDTPETGMAERMVAQQEEVQKYLSTITGQPVLPRPRSRSGRELGILPDAKKTLTPNRGLPETAPNTYLSNTGISSTILAKISYTSFRPASLMNQRWPGRGPQSHHRAIEAVNKRSDTWASVAMRGDT
jgi:hypothetical protein